ncbi:malate synthase A [Aquisalibacillus elongatus]|uniref:Malate synthase n=1 Tax=Aquisalibacillus elongatus TaxID=485577 RepID=A0A3N5BWT4_9BACI|nr:malate synthase A [Aquisalibacillus elongatus]RPF50335.1 malate synthase [Aquisalibacillus elongatus]
MTRIEVRGSLLDETILSEAALNFLADLHNKFNSRRKELLDDRKRRQLELQEGGELNFLSETEDIRNGDWTIEPLPDDLLDRRVEITGPVDRKMIINALNSGAQTFMADFEDATSPTWENVINGQRNLYDAIRHQIDFVGENGKSYTLNEDHAVLIVRPRGWHLDEAHLLIDGEPLSASLVDFGLYLFHNAKALMERGKGPYFYLPKLENHLEARLWNDVFQFAQEELGIPQGTIKATVLIETITAAFEMDEILYELRKHSAGLNCGRWDYIFSFIKNFHHKLDFILPDRATVTMETPFMRAYSLLAIQTCHKRQAPAIGGMAAQIPVKDDPVANEEAFEKVRKDKQREVNDGHDGTWVAHPGMVQLVKDVFENGFSGTNQIERQLDVEITQEDLLEVPKGKITRDGIKTNVEVGIQYIAAWLNGRGAAPLNHLMEDAATAEISRAQLWQWIHHPNGRLEDGTDINLTLVEEFVTQDLIDKYPKATELFIDLISQEHFEEFLTIPAYDYLVEGGVVK